MSGPPSLVVVGAGVFGASVARHCARAGWDVVLVERVAPGHVRAGSGDESRIIRCAHGADAWHTRSARRAWELWHEVDPALVVPSGVAWLARRDDGWEAASEALLRAEGIPCERVDASDLFPSVAVDDVRFTLFEPEAGILRARDAVKTLAAQAVAAGAELVLAEARPDAAAVVLDDGRRLEADRVVWACGGWLRDLFGGLVDLRVTRQELFFLDGGPEWRGAPGWVDFDKALYGTGDVDDLGVKAAHDPDGPPLDPDDALPDTDPASERLVRDLAAWRFPALEVAPLKGSKTCRYELSADGHFVVGEHPEQPSVWLVGGGSGHGFKHGPALAERIAAAWEGERPLPPEWAPAQRSFGRSLRTAGAVPAHSGPR